MASTRRERRRRGAPPIGGGGRGQLLIATIVGVSVLLASMLSVELGLSVAIIEIAFGVIGGNAFGVTSTPWIDFLASFAGIVLTFLAGAEVDPSLLRRKAKASLLIGGLS